jgi:hypothetical protein
MALPETRQNKGGEQMELALKQSTPRRQSIDIYQERLQTIMKIASGPKDQESRWWELRSVMDDYEWQDMQELIPETAPKNQMQTPTTDHSTTTGSMTGDSSSSLPKVNAAKRKLSSEQVQQIEKKREAAALKKQRLQEVWL